MPRPARALAAHFTAAGRSEPLTTLRLFEQWQKTLSEEGPPKAAQYAHAQHASYKRLAEIEHLSRELMQKLRQQRVEFGISLPPSGHTLTSSSTAAAAAAGDAAAAAAAAVASAAGGVEGTRDLLLHALILAAFSPNLAAGKAHAPTKVLEEMTRHRLDPARAVYCVVSGGSQGGAHLHQRHLAAALAPCGELQQAIISKSRGAGSGGAPALQTTVSLAFGTSASAILALRMAGLKGSLPVLLTNESSQVVGLAKLLAPQYEDAASATLRRRKPHDASPQPQTSPRLELCHVYALPLAPLRSATADPPTAPPVSFTGTRAASLSPSASRATLPPSSRMARARPPPPPRPLPQPAAALS